MLDSRGNTRRSAVDSLTAPKQPNSRQTAKRKSVVRWGVAPCATVEERVRTVLQAAHYSGRPAAVGEKAGEVIEDPERAHCKLSRPVWDPRLSEGDTRHILSCSIGHQVLSPPGGWTL